MPLTIHRSERMDALLGELALLLVNALGDPFTPDVIAVPSRGTERWVAQTLAGLIGSSAGREDGVCANVKFPLSGRMVQEAVAEVSGISIESDPWNESELTWPLIAVIDDSVGEDWCVPLARYLGLTEGGHDEGRRVAVAHKLARLFASYATQRPQLIVDWSEGRDTDGAGNSIDPDLLWQVRIWQRVRAAVDSPSPAERLEAACERIRSEPSLLSLPGRLSIFGPTRLPEQHLRIIDALGAHRDVHVWLHHPSPALWDGMRDFAGSTGARSADVSADAALHPLLRSFAREARETQLALTSMTAGTVERAREAPRTRDTVLSRLQAGIKENRPPALRPADEAVDGSLQIHACHGRHRQVEVLREVILGLLEDNPTLEQRDIIVMCPDVEVFAPLMSGVFGGGADSAGVHPGHRLRVRIADRSAKSTNPILDVVSQALEVADSRMTVGDIIGLASLEPVARRFRFSSDDLDRAVMWFDDANVRWGMDEDSRAPFGLGNITQNTWSTGLDRLLVGAAIDGADSALFDGVLPVDDVGSGDVDLAGRLVEMMHRVAATSAALRGSHPASEWATILINVIDELTLVQRRDEWQLIQAKRIVAEELIPVVSHRVDSTVSLADVRSLLMDALQGRPSRANFRTGEITVSSMVPMRSVPHRVVCLIGIDDGAFPRTAGIDGDDVLSRNPQVGERNARAEDKQLLLDSIMAAQDHLVIMCSGASERTGAEMPLAVPVDELIDAVPVSRDQLVVRHPLQTFDPQNFLPKAVPGSFDANAFAGASAQLVAKNGRPRFLAHALDGEKLEEITIGDLTSFFTDPGKYFLRHRLGLTLPDETRETVTEIPVGLVGLDRWGAGQRILGELLRSGPVDAAVAAELASGLLPPDQLGTKIVADLTSIATSLAAAVQSRRVGDAAQVQVDLQIEGGSRLTGSVNHVHQSTLVVVSFSRLAPKSRLRSWIELLAIAASRPDQSYDAVTVGRCASADEKNDHVVATASCAVVPSAVARKALTVLVGLYSEGMSTPLPFLPDTSSAYATERTANNADLAIVAAIKAWSSGRFSGFGDSTNADFARAHDITGFQGLLGAPTRTTFDHSGEPHFFGQVARLVWSELLDVESVTTT